MDKYIILQRFSSLCCIIGERGMNMELSPARRDGVMEAVKRYSSMVYRLAYARMRNHADAEHTKRCLFVKGDALRLYVDIR